MATASVSLSPPDPLKKKGNLGENWNQWKQNFKIYLTAADVDQSDTKAVALFLHTIGQYGRDIYNDLEMSDNEPLQELFVKFDNYCNPKTNLTFSRYQFFTTKQENNQPFDKFLIILKQKSKICEFGDLNNSLVMTQIIAGINNTRLRERLLRIPDLDLHSTVEECRSTEVSEAQAQKIAVAKVEKKQGKPTVQTQPMPLPTNPDKKQHPKKNPKDDQNQHKGPPSNVKSEQEGAGPKRIARCNFCGGSHVYGNCPAFGSTCHKCQKPNHYAKVCKN